MAQQSNGSEDAASGVAQGASIVEEEARSAWADLVAALPHDPRSWLVVAAIIFGAALAGWIVHMVVFFVLRRVARRSREGSAFGVIVQQMRRPMRIAFILLALKFAIPSLRAFLETDGELSVVNHALSIGVLATVTWLGVAVIEAAERIIQHRFRMDVDDNLRQRKIQTQTRVLVRAVQIVIVILGVAAILMTFEGVRQFGASLLASAGLAGLIIGLAARPVVANLIAGVQIALTQPIRIDDVVIIEGEWGRIEEITSTYVVVKIWDERRLIVPLSKFIEEPFQNWTRTSAQLLGTVFLYVDYRVPLDDLRAELERFVKGRPEWDGRVCQIVVTDATEKSMQIRALVSSGGSGRLWDLRCAVREHLINSVSRNHPGALPTLRVEFDQPEGEGAGTTGAPDEQPHE